MIFFLPPNFDLGVKRFYELDIVHDAIQKFQKNNVNQAIAEHDDLHYLQQNVEC